MRALALALGGIAALAALAAAAPAAGDAQRGERAYQKCYSCHALEPGKNDLTGPTLHAIIGRRIAAERFDYSEALETFARREGRWSPKLIDAYVADPEALVPGTAMHFHGIRNAQERADLLAFLSRAKGSARGAGGGAAR